MVVIRVSGRPFLRPDKDALRDTALLTAKPSVLVMYVGRPNRRSAFRVGEGRRTLPTHVAKLAHRTRLQRR